MPLSTACRLWCHFECIQMMLNFLGLLFAFCIASLNVLKRKWLKNICYARIRQPNDQVIWNVFKMQSIKYILCAHLHQIHMLSDWRACGYRNKWESEREREWKKNNDNLVGTSWKLSNYIDFRFVMKESPFIWTFEIYSRAHR